MPSASESLFAADGPRSLERIGFGESFYSFLNRSNWHSIDRVRQSLASWVSEIAPPDRERIISDIRSADDSRYYSGILELCTHKIASLIGTRVVMHPNIRDNGRSPDFGVTLRGRETYWECKIALPPEVERRDTRTTLEVVEVLQNEVHADVFLTVEIRSMPSSQPESSMLPKAVAAWVHELEQGDWRSNPIQLRKQFPLGDGVVDISATPAARSERPSDEKQVGFLPTPGRMVWGTPPVKRALRRKISVYGELNAPYVVVLAIHGSLISEESAIEALYGPFSWRGEGQDKIRTLRDRTGIWRTGAGPQNRSLSGVLFTSAEVQPWNLVGAAANWSFFPNPWANYQLPHDIFPFARVFSLEGLVLSGSPAATPITKLLGLPSAWPD